MLSPEQRELRKKYIGSSDLPAILGLDKFRTIGDVWLEKTGRIAKSARETKPQGMGHSFESAVIDYFAAEQGVVVERNLFLTNDIYCSNLDGLIRSVPEVVEAKTSGVDEDFGPTGTDEIPDRILVQVNEQMHVVSHALGKDCRVAWVPVLLPSYKHLEVRTYQIKRNDDLLENAIKIGNQFWHSHVLADTPPDIFKPSIDTLKRVHRQPNKTVTVADELVISWIDARDLRLQAEKDEKRALETLLAKMVDAEGAAYSGGLFTYLEQNRKGYTVEPSTYRVPRIQKGGAR